MTEHSLSPVRKAVIPIAGLGTRMLPLTKAVPKEMLPIGNKPVIQYAVEEAVRSGISDVILVAAATRGAALQYFRRDLQLEYFLGQTGREAEAELLRSLAGLANVSAVYQDEPRGLGHAIACARDLIGNTPFAVILPDALIVGPEPCLKQLIDAHRLLPGCYVATREVNADECTRFGMLRVSPVAAARLDRYLFRVEGMVEKPSSGSTPSRYGIFGRYLLEPQIFEYIDRTPPRHNGEIQLTDALALYADDLPTYALGFEGCHYDVGEKLGFLQASIALALQDPEFGSILCAFMNTVTANVSSISAV
jgi:UTP--glucose-1-phosphate uridylyltransferase